METRTALLHVVAPLSKLIAGKSISLNRLALPLKRLRIMPSTECSAEANDGAKNAAPLELEKPLQSYADKYPALLMGFSLIMWVSGTEIGVIGALATQEWGNNGIERSLHKKMTEGLIESELISITGQQPTFGHGSQHAAQFWGI